MLDGSIKNWPSILCCCLGGVRGIGQIGDLLGEVLLVVIRAVWEKIKQCMLCYVR